MVGTAEGGIEGDMVRTGLPPLHVGSRVGVPTGCTTCSERVGLCERGRLCTKTGAGNMLMAPDDGEAVERGRRKRITEGGVTRAEGGVTRALGWTVLFWTVGAAEGLHAGEGRGRGSRGKMVATDFFLGCGV